MKFWLFVLLLCGALSAEAKKSSAPLQHTSYEATLSAGFAALHRDDPHAALAAWRLLFAFDRPETRALWPRFVQLCEQTGQDQLRSASARDWARATRNLSAAASLSSAPDSQKTLGFITSWRVMGPFDNVGNEGFQRALPPEGHTAFSAIYKGKIGQPLRWHTPPLARGGLYYVSRFLGDDAPGVFYAATAFRVDTPQKIRLSFNYGGALKVWLNGALIIADNAYRPLQTLDPDRFTLTVSVPAGTSSLLLKIADDEKSEAAFSVRATPAINADAGLFKFQTLRVTTFPPPVFDVIAALKNAPLTSERAALLASVHRMNGDNEIAAQTLRDYLGQTPSAPGWLYEELAQALDENDPISARAVRERALQSDPRIVTSSLFLTSENAPLAGQILRLKALAQAHPQSPQTAWALSKIYLRAGQKDAALEAARRATSLAPGAPNQAALIEFLNSAGRRYEAGKTLDRALEKYPAAPLLWRLKAERALAQNDKSAAIAAWRKFYALDETQSGALHHVATLQEQLGAIQGALATRKAVRALRPQDAQAAKYLSAALRRNGDKNGAIATLREALQLDPTQVAWREELWILAGDKSVFDQVPGLIVREVAKPPSGADKNTRTHILLDEARQVVFADRATLTRYHQVIKIGDAAGAARYRKFALSLPVSARATLESLRIISNAKVRAVAANALQNNMLSLPALAIGDIVDLSYRVETAPPKEANPLTVQWYFGVAGTPVKTSRFVFITPVELPLMLRLHGEIPAPRVDDIRSGAAAWRVREWRLENVVADGALRLDIASAPAGHFAKP